MTWVKLDDGFAWNRKVRRLSDRAFRLHVAALCYCGRELTDGRIDDIALADCAAAARIERGASKVALSLVIAGLWRQFQDGYGINDWGEYNPSKDAVLDERKRVAERVRRSRGRGRNGVTNDVSNRGSNSVSNGTPYPSPSSSKEEQVRNAVTSRDADVSKTTVRYEHVCPECGVELKTAGRLAEHRWVSHDVPLPEEAER